MCAKLCICSTIPVSIRAFYGPQIEYLLESGFELGIVTSPDERFADELPEQVRYLPVTMTRSLTPWRDLQALCRLIRFFRKNRFDLVQYNTPKAALLCSIASLLSRVPVRLYLMWGLYYTGRTGWKRSFFKLFERIICRLSTHIAPDGNETRTFAIRERLCPAGKIEVVGNGSANGIDLGRFDRCKLAAARHEIRASFNLEESHVVVGTVARLGREKGINELVRGFAAAYNDRPLLRLLLVGPREMRNVDSLDADVQRLIEQHSAVVTTGFRQDVERYMAAMDIFTLPSWREGFGVVNLEAAAMELPVISTDVMGPRESVMDGVSGILVAVRDPAALAATILALTDDPERRRRLGCAGRRRVEQEFEQRAHWRKILEHRCRILQGNRAVRS
jgi:glycosyltransferase involved in cell wall biosynthesis